MTQAAPRIAVVGHTNAGKTALLRTLTRQVGFGEVSDRPGTTRHVEEVALRIAGRDAVVFLDTPGLEDSVNLREHLRRVAGDEATPPERIQAFLRGPEAHGMFEQEAKVLRTMLQADAAFLVIDTREPVLPKFRAEVELLGSCAKPVLPVLNFVRAAGEREADWRALLSAYGLHTVVRFDAAAPFVGAERELYHDLGALLNAHRACLQAVARALDEEADRRRDAAATRIADFAVQIAAMRRAVPGRGDVAASDRSRQVVALRAEVAARTQQCADDLLALYRFREGDADEAPLPVIEGRWSLDFFSPEAARDAGVRLGKGAAIGAAAGMVADVAMAGLSLGAATAIGATIGGAVSQGFGPAGRKLANLVTGTQELTVEDTVLQVLLSWLVSLAQALETRGHGSMQRIVQVDRPQTASRDTTALVAAVARTVAPARAHPRWEAHGRSAAATSARRQALVDAVAAALRPCLDPEPRP